MHTPKKPIKQIQNIARELCKNYKQFRLALTAVAMVVQERLGEDVILTPRDNDATEGIVYTREIIIDGHTKIFHFVIYGVPKKEETIPVIEELLRITLDVAHELGHLILERGPSHISPHMGMSPDQVKKLMEIEADWFAICILQMYGFIIPVKSEQRAQLLR